MADLRAKSLGYYRDGKVRVLHARCRPNQNRPCEVVAAVQGYTGRRVVEYRDDTWSCTCGDTTCAHIAAVQLATGHPSAAAKPQKASAAA